ncbi:hypothetical protein HK102_010687 [Quaeritorhiza haematococci]|nr:hypothetical protein HK102_010687 [Quaeritorhiza haematococci]
MDKNGHPTPATIANVEVSIEVGIEVDAKVNAQAPRDAIEPDTCIYKQTTLRRKASQTMVNKKLALDLQQTRRMLQALETLDTKKAAHPQSQADSQNVESTGGIELAELTSSEAPTSTTQTLVHPLEYTYGPFLRFANLDLENKKWSGSVLLVVHSSAWGEEGGQGVVLKFTVGVASSNLDSENREIDGFPSTAPSTQAQLVTARVLDKLEGYVVARYDIEVSVRESGDQEVRYWFEFPPGVSIPHPSDPSHAQRSDQHQEETHTPIPILGPFNFYVSGLAGPCHWGFYSCCGFSLSMKGDPEADLDGVRPLCRDLLRTHATKKMHYLIGLGDQIYQDDVFNWSSTLSEWMNIQNRVEREAAEFSDKMHSQCTRFYFTHYLAHFSQPVWKDVLASIPSVMLVDDHDVFDGVGSYPEALQRSPVFQGLIAVAKRFYLLFQHHTTIELAYTKDGFFGFGETPGFSFVKLLSPRTAILGVDNRFERTKEKHIVHPETWRKVFKEVLPSLPSSVKHLVYMAPVPLIWPSLGFVETLLDSISAIRRSQLFHRLFYWSGFFKQLGMTFGEPEILDDLIDHWSSPFHINERNHVIHLLQKFAKRTGTRVSIIAGDVHMCAVGLLRSESNNKSRSWWSSCCTSDGADAVESQQHTNALDAKNDHQLMYHFVSSALANEPPPKLVQWVYGRSACSGGIVEKGDPQKPLFEDVIDTQPHPPTTGDGDKGGRRTVQEWFDTFRYDVDGTALPRGRRRIMPRRNWCEVSELEDNTDDLATFSLHVEASMGDPEGKTQLYSHNVPRLFIS